MPPSESPAQLPAPASGSLGVAGESGGVSASIADRSGFSSGEPPTPTEALAMKATCGLPAATSIHGLARPALLTSRPDSRGS